MPTPTYNSLLTTVAAYIEKEKVIGILERQLKAKNLTPDTLASKDLANLMTAVSTATSLYVPDAGRKEELKNKLKAMAA